MILLLLAFFGMQLAFGAAVKAAAVALGAAI
jgi:hypothetical protein